jgi:hypothetical protein
VVVLFEICADCYKEHFLNYKNMKIKTSKELHKCCGCGKNKQVVREVWADGKLVDIN